WHWAPRGRRTGRPRAGTRTTLSARETAGAGWFPGISPRAVASVLLPGGKRHSLPSRRTSRRWTGGGRDVGPRGDVVGRLHAGGERHGVLGRLAPPGDRAGLSRPALLPEARADPRRGLLRHDVLRRPAGDA